MTAERNVAGQEADGEQNIAGEQAERESTTDGEKHWVASTDELAEDGSKIIADIDGVEVAVFNLDGEYYALANYCIHQGGPLCEGPTTGQMVGGDDGWEWNYVDEGKIVSCPWHSWRFDIRTGKNTKDDSYTVPTYDVTVEDGDVFVYL
jgi:nitrite reductase/ring-hydroxylating ferredoxin subunit